ncbi:MAG: hypothetical protein QOF73_5243 [Thermomicrobiales bacterium]|nr:hypothetical protein [Thermomicrobiales bacterium]
MTKRGLIPSLRLLPRALRASPSARLLVSGSAWSLLVQAVSKGTVLFTTLVAARALGVADFGLFISLQAIVLLSVSLWDFGVTPMTTRDLAAHQVAIGIALRRALVTRLWILPLWFVVFAGGSWALEVRSGHPLVAAMLFALAAWSMGISGVLNGLLQGRMRFRESAYATAGGRIAFALAIAAVAVSAPDWGLPAMTLAFLAGEVVTLALMIRAIRHELAAPFPLVDPPAAYRSTRGTLRRSSPFAFNGFFNLVYNRLDVAIVALLAGSVEAGIYAPASRIQDALLFFPSVATAALMPVAARRFGANRDTDAVRRPLPVLILLGVVFALPAVVATVIFARPLVMIALGDQYEASVEPVRILALSIPFIAAGAPVMASLVAIDRARTTTVVYGCGLLAALGGLAILTPLWGATGAAWASMAREPIIAAVALGAFYGGASRLTRRSNPSDRGPAWREPANATITPAVDH